ncbi:unnamed protein product, partial [Rotaria sp. Silwood1]
MLLSSSHVHFEYVHPEELSCLEELLNMINLHIDRYSKHELIENSTTPNTPPTTPRQQEHLSSTRSFYHGQPFYL